MRKLAMADAAILQVAIRQELDRSEESRYEQRLHRLVRVASGRSGTEVSHLLGEAATTVKRWGHRFAEYGFAGLCEGERPRRPRSLDERQWKRLARELRRAPLRLGHRQHLWDGPLLAEHLRRDHRVVLGGGRARDCSPNWDSACERHGRKSPRRIWWLERRFKNLRRLARRKDMDLGSVDDCHFQQQGPRLSMGVPPESTDPGLRHAPTRTSIAGFGAGNVPTGQFVRAFCPQFDARTFQAFLQQLLRHRSQTTRRVIVRDNARYHHAALLAPRRRTYRRVLTRRFRPPYSPLLAPLERVWTLARRVATRTR